MNFAQLVVDGVCPSHRFLEEMEAVFERLDTFFAEQGLLLFSVKGGG